MKKLKEHSDVTCRIDKRLVESSTAALGVGRKPPDCSHRCYRYVLFDSVWRSNRALFSNRYVSKNRRLMPF